MAGTRPLTPQKLAALEAALGSLEPRDAALITFLYRSGLRVSEALGFTVVDAFDGSGVRGRVRVRRRRLKGGRGPWKASVAGWSIPLHPDIVRTLVVNADYNSPSVRIISPHELR